MTPTFDGLYDRVVKVVGISKNYGTVERCEEDVQESLGTEVSAARSQPFYLDVTHPKANKSEVVVMASEFAGILSKRLPRSGICRTTSRCSKNTA